VFSAITLIASASMGMLYGAPGVLLGMLGSKTLMRLVGLARIRRSEGWNWSTMLPWGDWAIYLMMMAAASCAAWLLHEPTDGGIRWLLIGGVVFSIIYLFGTATRVLQRRARTMTPRRVIQLTQYLGIGGLERVILSLAEGLHSRGDWLVSIFVYDRIPGNPTLHPEFEKKGIPVTDFDKGSGLSFKAVYTIACEVIRTRTSVIHSHDLGALIYAVLTKLLLFGAVRVVHTQHSFVHLERSPRYRKYERYFSFFADSLCTVSEGLKSQYRRVDINPATIDVIGNGVVFPTVPPPASLSEREILRRKLIEQISDSETRNRFTDRLDRVWILCMARIHAKKGQEHVVDVWSTLDLELRRKAFLVFVGQETSRGAVDLLMSRVNALDEPGEVGLAGYTRSGPEWLHACEIFASGSEFEGMPLGPIEAAGAGMRLLLSDIPGHQMIPGDAERFDFTKSKSQSPKLARLLSDLVAPDSAIRMRLEGWNERSSIRHKFGIEVMAERYQALYEKDSLSIGERFTRLETAART
jgi:glycosyltransferase involved in cell wall biosynthesis